MILDRKIQERAILDQFRKHYPDFPKGKIIPSESPDFILKTSPKRSIGIELSSLPSLSYHIQNKADLQRLIQDIQVIISKKDGKIKLYRNKLANEYWLILHVDSIQNGKFNLKDLLERIERDDRFKKLILYDLFEGRVINIG